jgi:hypothetical protein
MTNLADTYRNPTAAPVRLNGCSRLQAAARAFALLFGLVALAACGESATAPQQSIDRIAAARVMPAVTDARVRLAVGIDNAAVRERMTHDLMELESALLNGDGQKARFHVRVLGTVIADYRAQQRNLTTDGADVTAIVLMLHAVSQAVDAGFEFPLSP